jgi:hypothetical protein
VRPRFQADNDLRSSIRTGVLRRESSLDFQSAGVAKLDGVPDLEVLRLAAESNRILISHDENSMPGYFRAFLAAGNASPGVMIVPQGASISAVIESIIIIWIASEASEWAGRIIWLPL